MSWRAQEYFCPVHGRWDTLVARVEAWQPHPCPTCGLTSDPAISAPLGRVKLGEVARGKVAKPPGPQALDTQALADGMPIREWRAQRRKMWDETQRRALKAKTG